MSKGPVNTKYELYLMKKRGEKIDPNVMVDNSPDIQLNAHRYPAGGLDKVKYVVKQQVNLRLPTTDKELNKLADDLLEWVIAERPTEIREFFWKRKISYYTFKKKANKTPYLEEALILAGEIISGKIMDSWLKKEFDGNAAHKVLWAIDRGYKEERSEEKKLDKITDEDKEIRFIYDTKEEK